MAQKIATKNEWDAETRLSFWDAVGIMVLAIISWIIGIIIFLLIAMIPMP